MSQRPQKHAPPAWRPDAIRGAGRAGAPSRRLRRSRVLPPLLRASSPSAWSGLEHLPERGPYIVAANHANYLDGVVLGAALPPQDQLPGHAARVPGDAAPSVLPRPRRLDPGLARAARPRRHPPGAAGARAGRRRRHLPRGPVQRARHARPRPARRRLLVASAPASRWSRPASRAPSRPWRRGASSVPRRVPLGVRFGKPLRFSRPRRR